MGTEPKPHTLDDHVYGDTLDHDHGPDADHDHDDFEALGPLDENPIWLQDNVVLTSVGMDIGSSGTQILFSRLHLRRISEDLSSRYVVTRRETLYESPVALTPYRDASTIDEAALGAIIDAAYGAARVRPEGVDTGVVILTGEALRRENAQSISEILAEKGGEFVCATAGHHMEARLAAYGSGAARASHDSGKRLLNVDIGGGTTKLAIVENGAVKATGAIHIGGRLAVVDADGRIARLDPAGQHHAGRAGFDWTVGSQTAPGELDAVAELMAATLAEALCERPSPAARALYLTDPIEDFGGIEGIVVSGGVGEYVYGRETRDFGDLGRRLGAAFARRLEALAWPLLPAGACIRATALGASEYTVQLSGNTSHISSPGKLLPRRNLQVVQPEIALGELPDPARVAEAIRAHLETFDLLGSPADIAFALRWEGVPSHKRLRLFAEGIFEGLKDRIAAGQPLYLMLDGDVAMTLGRILARELEAGCEILVIDSVQLLDFDYIDLGKIRLPSKTVPVTIKSLVFNEDPRAHHARERIHHHGHGPGHHHHHGGGHSH